MMIMSEDDDLCCFVRTRPHGYRLSWSASVINADEYNGMNHDVEILEISEAMA